MVLSLGTTSPCKSMRHFTNSLPTLIAVGIVYFVAGKLGLMLAFVHPSATAVWPPAGIALAAFLLLGYRVWPAIFFGAFLVNIVTAGSIATSIGIGTGNTLEGFVGAYLVNRFAGGLNAFDRARDIFRFALLAGLASTMVSATFGATSLALGGVADWANYGAIWLTWWLGDAAGDLIIAPLVMLWSTGSPLRWKRGQAIEAVVLLLCLFLAAQSVFGGWLPFEMKNYPLEFACIPFLVWAAFRFGPRESATAIFILSGLAIWGTLRGYGPFVRTTPNESLLLLQTFMGVIAVMITAMAAVLSERNRFDEERARFLGLEQTARAEAEAGRQRVVNVLESITEVFLALDQEWRITYLNRGGEKFLQKMRKTRGELIGKNVWDAFPDAKRSRLYLEFHRAIAEQVVIEFEEFYPPVNAWFEVRAYPSRDGLSVYFHDVTERKAQTAALKHQAMHDVLTGLPNRILLQDRLNHAIMAGRREGQSLTLAILDLDRFKEINDTLGHQAGDLILRQIGQRLQSMLRESDTVARLGGDEFAVLLPTVGLEGAALTAQKILDLLETPFSLEGVALDVGVSIGIALFPEHGEDGDTLMRHADTAMYRAKQAGHGYVVYASEDDKQSHRRLMLVSELRAAIEHEGLLLHYQPKIDLRTGRVTGVEALVRWQHPKNGLFLPSQFIPVAERSGLIKPLTLWVLKAALRQCHAWHQMGLDISIAVNLSSRALYDPELPEQIARSLAVYHVEPRLLELEIPERIAMADTVRVSAFLTRLGKEGVGLCIDDIGAGFSSLGHLKTLPVAEIKIGKSLIMDMITDEKNAVIVRSAIELGHHLGFRVVAKGVENRETRDRLAALGCDMALGYYISHPLPAVELTRWLTSRAGA